MTRTCFSPMVPDTACVGGGTSCGVGLLSESRATRDRPLMVLGTAPESLLEEVRMFRLSSSSSGVSSSSKLVLPLSIHTVERQRRATPQGPTL